MSKKPDWLEDERLTSEEVAGLIVDALVMAGLIDKSANDGAVAIVAEEIEVRKVFRDS